MASGFAAAHPSRRPLRRAPQDEVFFRGAIASPHGEEPALRRASRTMKAKLAHVRLPWRCDHAWFQECDIGRVGTCDPHASRLRVWRPARCERRAGVQRHPLRSTAGRAFALVRSAAAGAVGWRARCARVRRGVSIRARKRPAAGTARRGLPLSQCLDRGEARGREAARDGVDSRRRLSVRLLCESRNRWRRASSKRCHRRQLQLSPRHPRASSPIPISIRRRRRAITACRIN